ncbi:hypothetical protein PG994_006352 [Apiospora phragmitis]|uniref:Small ribosomal subunit protein uS7 domain-containing protein n=1 Tax=Apiospora phragmitis TaxID=2905665 RepID=A0ABR1VET1_9PEZI
MASKLSPWGVCRSLTIRTRSILQHAERKTAAPFHIARRGLADDTTSREPPSGSGGALPPSMAGQSSVERSYTPPPPEHFAPNWLNADAISKLEQIAAGEDLYDEDVGLKFGKLSALPGKKDHLQKRYPEVIDQVTKLLMRDGKLSKAQRDMSLILNFLRTSSAPKVSPIRPLLPGSPPAYTLPLDPVLYMTLAIDSVAPLLRIRSMKGMAGGGNALEVPEPMPARQRRRVAIQWILDAVNKKKSKGSGRAMFAHRVAEEIVSVIEGRSTVWDRRQTVHKLGTAARANLNHPALLAKRRK